MKQVLTMTFDGPRGTSEWRILSPRRRSIFDDQGKVYLMDWPWMFFGRTYIQRGVHLRLHGHYVLIGRSDVKEFSEDMLIHGLYLPNCTTFGTVCFGDFRNPESLIDAEHLFFNTAFQGEPMTYPNVPVGFYGQPFAAVNKIWCHASRIVVGDPSLFTENGVWKMRLLWMGAGRTTKVTDLLVDEYCKNFPINMNTVKGRIVDRVDRADMANPVDLVFLRDPMDRLGQ